MYFYNSGHFGRHLELKWQMCAYQTHHCIYHTLSIYDQCPVHFRYEIPRTVLLYNKITCFVMIFTCGSHLGRHFGNDSVC